MNDEIKPDLGVATTLPPAAVERLTRAAEHARTLPVGSAARTLAISRAIKEVKAYFPELFVEDGGSVSAGGEDRRGRSGC